MNKKSRLITTFFLGAAVFLATPTQTHAHQPSAKKMLKSDKDVVNDALRAMKQQIKNPKGNHHMLACTYGFDKNGTLTTKKTEVHYSDYRMQPDQQEQILAHGNVVRTIKVVYNKADKKHVSLIEKHKKRLLKERDIKIAPTVFA